MKAAIGYCRVSTREQGRSGLGLAAQRADIRRFSIREGFRIERWYQDIQTGAGKDALLLRPGLAAALKDARARRCPLMVAKLDRLSRNVMFITGLMEHKVHFMVAALGRDCDDFTLHIYASLAEQERKLIAQRCQAAMHARKRRGQKFGVQLRSKAWQRHIGALGRAAMAKLAHENAEAHRLQIEWALRQPGLWGGPISFQGAAQKLNDRQIPSIRGTRWTGQQLLNMSLRLGLRHPRRMPTAVARLRIRTLWNQNPGITGRQVIASIEPGYRLSLRRARDLLRECRLSAASRTRIHARMKWRIDHRSSIRLRIHAVWVRQPLLTAEEVWLELGSGHAVDVGKRAAVTHGFGVAFEQSCVTVADLRANHLRPAAGESAAALDLGQNLVDHTVVGHHLAQGSVEAFE